MSETTGAVQATIEMYDRIGGQLGEHFEGFRDLPGINSALYDMQVSHRLAGVPLGKGNVVEIGPGNGRDAAAAFVPHAAVYTSFGPAPNEQAVARRRVDATFPGQYSPEELDRMFQVGFAQSAELPQGVDVAHAVNSFTVHTPFAELPGAFSNVGESFRGGGILHILTKVAVNNLVEFNPNESFPGAEGMTPRTFYFPSASTLLDAARKARLEPVLQEKVEVPSKPWDWGVFGFQRAA